MKTWFYLKGAEQIGPVTESEFQTAQANGNVTAQSLVWCEGMADWLPLGQVKPDTAEGPVVEGTAPAGVDSAVYQAEPSEPARPTSVTAFGVMNIIFGGKALLCLPFSIPLMLVGFKAQPDMFPDWYIVAVLVLHPLAFFAGILELSSGIGLLKCKLWARKAAIAYGFIALGLGVLGMIVEGSFLLSSMQATPELIGGAIGGIIGGIVGVIYPILLLVFMRKPAAVEACVK